jgi:hypothetical protein
LCSPINIVEREEKGAETISVTLCRRRGFAPAPVSTIRFSEPGSDGTPFGVSSAAGYKLA